MAQIYAIYVHTVDIFPFDYYFNILTSFGGEEQEGRIHTSKNDVYVEGNINEVSEISLDKGLKNPVQGTNNVDVTRTLSDEKILLVSSKIV